MKFNNLFIFKSLFILNNSIILMGMMPIAKPTLPMPNVNLFNNYTPSSQPISTPTPSITIKPEQLKSIQKELFSSNQQPAYFYGTRTPATGFLRNTSPLLSQSYKATEEKNICSGLSTKQCLFLLSLMLGGIAGIDYAWFQYMYPGGETFRMPFEASKSARNITDTPYLEKSYNQKAVENFFTSGPDEDEIWKFLSDTTSGRITPKTHKIAHTQRISVRVKNTPIPLNTWQIITTPLSNEAIMQEDAPIKERWKHAFPEYE